MNDRGPVIVVAGLGRCGSSVTMQMLSAGGVPCVGDAPGFEDERTSSRINPLDMLSWRGRAVKILDPHKTGLPRGVETRVIWLDRSPKQQARSQSKFIGAMTGIAVNRERRLAMQASLRAERQAALAEVGTRPLLILRFEDIIADPLSMAAGISDFLRAAHDLDPRAMAAVVRPRPATCMPDMSIELALAREARAA